MTATTNTAPTATQHTATQPTPAATPVAWQDAYGSAALVNVSESDVPFNSFTSYSHAIADDAAFFAAVPTADTQQQALQQKLFLADGLLHANLCGADVSDFMVQPPQGSTDTPRLLVDIILDDSHGEAVQHKAIIDLMNKAYYDENTVFHADKKVNALVHDVLLKVSSEVQSIDTTTLRHDYANKSQPSCPLSLSDSVEQLVSGETAEVLVRKEMETYVEATGGTAERFSRAVKNLVAAGIPLLVSGSGYEIQQLPAVPPATQGSVKIATSGEQITGALTAYLPYGMESNSSGQRRGPSVLVEVTDQQGVRRLVVPITAITEVEIQGTGLQRARVAEEILCGEIFFRQLHGVTTILDPDYPVNRQIGVPAT